MIKEIGGTSRAPPDSAAWPRPLAGHIHHFSIREAGQRGSRPHPKAGGSHLVTPRRREKIRGKTVILFRIFQECLQNCLKHAAGPTSTSASLVLRATPCPVRDDGAVSTRTGPHRQAGTASRSQPRPLTAAPGPPFRPGEGTTSLCKYLTNS